MSRDIFAHLNFQAGERVGLFGGTFDPPHRGHVHAAMTALDALKLDRLIALVTPGNLLKDAPHLSLETRKDRLSALLQDRRIVVSDVEAQLGTSATIDLVTACRSAAPDTSFVWVMGGDNLRHFHQWRDWDGILARLPVAIVARGETADALAGSVFMIGYAQARLSSGEAAALPGTAPPAWVYLESGHVNVSSSQLRDGTRHPDDIETKSP